MQVEIENNRLCTIDGIERISAFYCDFSMRGFDSERVWCICFDMIADNNSKLPYSKRFMHYKFPYQFRLSTCVDSWCLCRSCHSKRKNEENISINACMLATFRETYLPTISLLGSISSPHDRLSLSQCSWDVL